MYVCMCVCVCDVRRIPPCTLVATTTTPWSSSLQSHLDHHHDNHTLIIITAITPWSSSRRPHLDHHHDNHTLIIITTTTPWSRQLHLDHDNTPWSRQPHLDHLDVCDAELVRVGLQQGGQQRIHAVAVDDSAGATELVRLCGGVFGRIDTDNMCWGVRCFIQREGWKM